MDGYVRRDDKSTDKPWQSKEILKELYHRREMNQREIADELGVSRGTVSRWMSRHDLETRSDANAKKDGRYKDEEWLRETYHGDGKTVEEIAEIEGVCSSTVNYWMQKHGVEGDKTRTGLPTAAYHYFTKSGYETWRADGRYLGVHRLVAVAEYGFDAVSGNVVQHENGVPWDNRPENLRPRGRGDLSRENNLMHVESISESVLIEGIHLLADELDRRPTSRLMDGQGRHSHTTYVDYFGSWDDAMIAAGYEPYETPAGEDHPLWDGGTDTYYGPNWGGQRERAIKRDGGECAISGCTVSREEHYEQYGYDFHVHHITRKESFRNEDGTLDYESANQLENLLTLCHTHHREYEGVPIDTRHQTGSATGD